jgi:hypothetical protein
MQPRLPPLLVIASAALAGCASLLGIDDIEVDGDAGAGDVDAGSGLFVRVEVTRDGAPSAGLPVILHRADGTVLAEATTRADGTAEHELAGEALVTLSYGEGDLIDLHTWVVEPGDVVGIDVGAAPLGASVEIQSPDPGAVNGVPSAGQAITVGCDAELVGTPGPAFAKFDDLTAACLDSAGRLAVVAVAFDDAGEPLATSVSTAIDVVMPTTSVSLPAFNMLPGTGLTVTVNGASNPSVTPAAVIDGVRFLALVDAAGNIRIPGDFIDGHEIDIQDLLQGSSRRVRLLVPLDVNQLALDMGQAALAATALEVERADPDRPGLRWLAPPEPVDLALLAVEDSGYRWRIEVPGDREEAQIPALPESLAGVRPPDTAVLSATVIDATELLGYRGVRGRHRNVDALRAAPLDAVNRLRESRAQVQPAQD